MDTTEIPNFDAPVWFCRIALPRVLRKEIVMAQVDLNKSSWEEKIPGVSHSVSSQMSLPSFVIFYRSSQSFFSQKLLCSLKYLNFLFHQVWLFWTYLLLITQSLTVALEIFK